MAGKMPEDRMNDLHELGIKEVKTSVAIRGEEESKPYRIGVYRFREKCGLYIIIGYSDESVFDFAQELFDSLSFTGIGGKRNSGFGNFYYYDCDISDTMSKYLQWDNTCSIGKFMTLSVSLPKDDEMEEIIENSEYQLIKRSGFVYSNNYSEEQLRKKDLYVFEAGSCFGKVFEGDIYDVSSEGRHPVYRYAKPIFLKLD